MHPPNAVGAPYGACALGNVIPGTDSTGPGLAPGARVRALTGEQKKQKKEKEEKEGVSDLRGEARTGQREEYAPRRKNGGGKGGGGGMVKKVWEVGRHLARLPTGSLHHEEAASTGGIE